MSTNETKVVGGKNYLVIVGREPELVPNLVVGVGLKIYGIYVLYYIYYKL